MKNTNLPPQQLSILNRCFHPSGTFAEFEWEEVERSVSARFENQVRLYPHNLAIKPTSQEINYSDLNRNANQVAHAVLGRSGTEDSPAVLLFDQEIQVITELAWIIRFDRRRSTTHRQTYCVRLWRRLDRQRVTRREQY